MRKAGLSIACGVDPRAARLSVSQMNMKYEIAQSNGRGGKAGSGKNKTATIQVREPIRPGENLLKAQFRYALGNSAAMAMARAKARAWIKSARAPRPCL